MLLQAVSKAWERRIGDPFCYACLLCSLTSSAWDGGDTRPVITGAILPEGLSGSLVQPACAVPLPLPPPSINLILMPSAQPLLSVPVDAFSPLLSVSADFQISDTISTYFVCYLLH